MTEMFSWRFQGLVGSRDGFVVIVAPDKFTALREAHDKFDASCRASRQYIPDIRPLQLLEKKRYVRHT